MSTVAIVVLAAGSSSRLGKPKQLLNYQNQTLLQRSIEVALASETGPILVIVNDMIAAQLETLPPGASKLINHRPLEGMAGSISLATEFIAKEYPSVEAIIFTACDQPFVTAEVLQQLVAAWQQTNKTIIACAYNGTLGIPALFQKEYFEKLVGLKGDKGAKQLIVANPEEVATIEFQGGAIDIDTAADYEELLHNYNKNDH